MQESGLRDEAAYAWIGIRGMRHRLQDRRGSHTCRFEQASSGMPLGSWTTRVRPSSSCEAPGSSTQVPNGLVCGACHADVVRSAADAAGAAAEREARHRDPPRRPAGGTFHAVRARIADASRLDGARRHARGAGAARLARCPVASSAPSARVRAVGGGRAFCHQRALPAARWRFAWALIRRGGVVGVSVCSLSESDGSPRSWIPVLLLLAGGTPAPRAR
jgi:hypothetical protein